MEQNVSEAVRNNVFGLQQLLEVAERHDCKSFVLISSDKAVNPTSIMGATKRICELILAARPAGQMRCVAVRFGNVLGSNGSVVPIFQEQLRQGRALTITHPEIRRFFMTAREAVSLVLQAGAIGQCGDILVLEMGAPIRIVDMARTLIRLSGKREDVCWVCLGVFWEGEKLEEALSYEQEEVLPTDSAKIRRIHGFQPDWIGLSRQLEELQASLNVDGAAPIRAKVNEIVPEYKNPCADSAPVSDLVHSEVRVKQASASD